jgi:hypothetical protein
MRAYLKKYTGGREMDLCKKNYAMNFDPKLFLDPAIEGLYPLKDYHRIFIGEIELCMRRDA